MTPRSTLLACLLSSGALLAPGAHAQGGVSPFCQSGAAGAAIHATGSTDFNALGGSGELVLHATGLPAGALGLFFYGAQTQPAAPLGNGFLCVGGGAPIWRLGLVAAAPTATTVASPVDFLAPPSPAAQITPGSTWNFQFWFRSAGTSDTTDGISVQFVPPVPLTPVTPVAQFNHGGHPLGQSFTGGVVVINSTTEMRDFWDLHSIGFQPAPPVPPVNWNQSTVIAVYIGRRFSGGYSVNVSGVDLSISTLHVASEESIPCNGATFGETSPFVLVSVPKILGATLGSWSPVTLACP